MKLSAKKLYLLLIIILTFLAYSNIFTNEFVWDDNDFIVNWDATRNLANLPAFFKGLLPQEHIGVYRPMRSVAYAISYKIWGVDSGYYHLQSLLLHIVCTILIYLIITKIASNRIIGLMSALLFGVHPVHVEAVTFITTSFDIIGVVFFLASFYFYIMAAGKNHNYYYYLSLMFAVLAIFTYEFCLILPLLIILYDNTIRKTTAKITEKRKKLYYPYLTIAFFYLIIRFYILKIVGRGAYLADSLYYTFLTMLKVFLKYVSLIIVPINLNFNHLISKGLYSMVYVDYNESAVISQSIFDFNVLFSLALIIALVFIAYKSIKKFPLISFSIGLFFIGLLPVSNIIPLRVLMAEQYLYISSIGYCLALSYIIYSLAKKLSNTIDKKTITMIFSILFIVIIAIFSFQTYARNQDWKDSKTLWEVAVRDSPGSSFVNNNLGKVYYDEGNMDLAIEYLKTSIELNPNYSISHNSIAAAYSNIDEFELAIEHYTLASDFDPPLGNLHINLGLTYRDNNQSDFAIAEFKAHTIKYPNDFEGFYNLALVYHDIGKYEKAIINYKQALELNPLIRQIYMNLGETYQQINMTEDAIKAYNFVLKIRPEDDEALYNLGLVYHSLEDFDMAIEHYQNALYYNSGFTNAIFNLAYAYQQQENYDQAMDQYLRYLELVPEDYTVYYNIGLMYLKVNNHDQAQLAFENVLALDPGNKQAQQYLEYIKETRPESTEPQQSEKADVE